MSFFNLKKLGVIGIGFLGTEAINQSFDWILYPLVITLLGPIKGGAVMVIFALILNYSLVWVYRQTKEDWFGFEWMRLQEEEKSEGTAGKILRFLMKGGKWPAFVFLSWEDPFKAFVFVRGRKTAGAKFNTEDWVTFIGANLIGNLIWIIMVSGALEIIKSNF